MQTIQEPHIDPKTGKFVGGVYNAGNLHSGIPETEGIKLAVYTKHNHLIGYKLDTFWSLGKNGYKEHSYGDEFRLVSSFLSRLNADKNALFGRHKLAIREEITVKSFDLKDGKLIRKMTLTKDQGIWSFRDTELKPTECRIFNVGTQTVGSRITGYAPYPESYETHKCSVCNRTHNTPLKEKSNQCPHCGRTAI